MPDPTKQTLALVTGGAVRLGRSISLALAQAGYALAIHYYSSRVEAESLKHDLNSLGTPAALFPANLTNPVDVENLFSEVSRLPQRLGVLINNAAMMPSANLDETSIETWDNLMSLNVRAPWLCSRFAVRLMMPEGGVIINIADAGAGKAWLRHPLYALSKSALIHLTRLQARSYAPAVRVNAVAPGLVLRSDTTSEAEWARSAEKLPLGTATPPEDIASAVLAMINNHSITGQTLVVDNGYQLL